jgi:hypothetical protein
MSHMIGETDLFECFGGIRPMAKELGERPTTVQAWKSTGRVPASKQPLVLDRASELHLDVVPYDVVFPLSARAAPRVIR